MILDKDIALDKELLVSYKSDENYDRNTVQVEKDWTNTNQQFVYKAFPSRGMLPYFNHPSYKT